ncbi:MAG: single-stranded DNA-binding protein [Phycisphaera sp.]|nr:single-stranded DNA-binding protein [Phycisphaera sp.]
MPNLNKVMLMGNLTRDPEMRYTNNNLAICKLGLAINRRWRNQQGETQEETTFVDCDAFGKTAEMINQYLRKGRPIFIEGRLRLDQWQDKEGHNRSKLGVVIENFQFVDSKPQGDDANPGGGGGYASAPRSAPRSAPPSRPHPDEPPAHEPVEEDHIPF